MWEGGRGPNLKLTHMLQQMTLVYKNRRQQEFGCHDGSKGTGGAPLDGQTFNDKILPL